MVKKKGTKIEKFSSPPPRLEPPDPHHQHIDDDLVAHPPANLPFFFPFTPPPTTRPNRPPLLHPRPSTPPPPPTTTTVVQAKPYQKLKMAKESSLLPPEPLCCLATRKKTSPGLCGKGRTHGAWAGGFASTGEGRRGLILIFIFYIDLLPLFFWFLSRAGKWNELVVRAGWNFVINHHFEILSRTRVRVGLSRGCLLSLVYSGGVCRTALFP